MTGIPDPCCAPTRTILALLPRGVCGWISTLNSRNAGTLLPCVQKGPPETAFTFLGPWTLSWRRTYHERGGIINRVVNLQEFHENAGGWGRYGCRWERQRQVQQSTKHLHFWKGRPLDFAWATTWCMKVGILDQAQLSDLHPCNTGFLFEKKQDTPIQDWREGRNEYFAMRQDMCGRPFFRFYFYNARSRTVPFTYFVVVSP